MDRLSREILREICSYLEPYDILFLRRQCRVLAAIGLYYMIPEAHIAFLPESFARLAILSEHPILSQCLRKLVYEGNTLPVLETQKHWMGLASGAINSSHGPMQLSRSAPNPPSNDASERTRRAYRRDLHQFEREKASAEQFRLDMTKGSWKVFQSFQRWQSEMQESGGDLEFLQKSIAKFPRLKELGMAAGNRRGQGLSATTINAYHTCLLVPSFTEPMNESGLKQLRVLLEAASNAPKSLLQITASQLGWHFFNQSVPTFEALEPIQSLRFTVSSPDYLKEVGKPYGRIWPFLKLAPNLKDLDMEFQGDNRMEAIFFSGQLPSRQGIPILSHVFAIANWHQLMRLRLVYVQSVSHLFLNFLRRHARTLKNLWLSIHSLLGATWGDTFWEMKSILHLDEATFTGFFISGQLGATDYDSRIPMDVYSSEWGTTRGGMVGRMLCGEADLTRPELELILEGSRYC